MKKRGQVPTAATFVLLFLLFMLGFILLLPPEERVELLGGEFGKGDEDVLLNEQPSVVGPGGGVTRVNLFDAHLFSEIDTEVGDLLGNLFVNKNVFFGKDKNVSFSLRDLEKLESASLFYSVAESKGRLIIYLNSNEVYNGYGNNLLGLNKDYLKEGKNDLTFSCSGFICKYDLRNLKIIKRYVVDNRKAERFFSLNKKNVRSASLNYYLDCIGDERGNLKVSINGNGLLSDRFLCNNYETNDIPLGFLKDLLGVKDDNKIVFEIDKGDVILRNVFIETETSGSRLLYFFELDENQYGEVKDGTRDVILEMLFNDYSNDDWLKVYINDDVFDFKVVDFDRLVISDYVKKRRNSISLRAMSDFEIVDLTVRLE